MLERILNYASHLASLKKNKKAQQSADLERFDCNVRLGFSVVVFPFCLFFFFLLTKKSIRLKLATSERHYVAQK